MKLAMQKLSVDELVKAGYSGYVLVPVDDNLLTLPNEVNVEIKANKKRTLTQNASIHKYCELLGNDLNAAGYDMRTVIKDEIDIPWTMDSVKDNLWRTIQKAMKLPDSTTDLTTTEVSQVYDVLARHMALKFGITTPFPTRFGN